MAVTRHWLLDLTIDGRVYRWSTEALDVVDTAGATHRYEAGLGALTAAVADSTSVSVSDPVVPWPTVGLLLDGSPALLRRWTSGTVLESAETYTSGEVVDATWSTRYEPVALSISVPVGPETLGSPMPDREAAITASTWPVDALHTIGATSALYPVVLGYPGYEGTTSSYPVMPVPLAQWEETTPATTYLVIAEDQDAQITSAEVYSADYDVTSTLTVSLVADLLGRQLRTCHFATIAALQPTTTAGTHFAALTPSGGGGVARDAYSVLRYLLERWGPATVDWGRMPELADLLGAYQVDTWIDAAMADPWAWLESTVLADLPVEPRRGAHGWYLLHRRYVAVPGLVVGAYSVDDGTALRRSGLQRDGSPLNRWTAAYRLDRDLSPRARAYLVGSPPSPMPSSSSAQQVRVAQHSRCLASEARWGIRDAGDLTIDWTWDTGTVLACLEWRAERWAVPARLVSYDLTDDEQLREGDQIEITDADVGLTSAVAIVDAPPIRGLPDGRSSVTLRIPEAT